MPTTTNSTWQDVKSPIAFPSLHGDARAEVAVIGGGITGLVTAYCLSRAGKDVAVFEADQIGAGATAYTTAFAVQDIDTDLSDLVSMLGDETAGMVWQSNSAAIDILENIVETDGIDCEWRRCSVWVYANTPKEFKTLEKEAEVAKRLGFSVRLGSDDLGFRHAGYLEIPRQAKFHPLKFLYQLSQSLFERGVRIYEKTEIESIKSSSPLLLHAKEGNVTADWSVMATYYPIGRQSGTRFKKGMYKSYVMEAQIPSGALKEGLYMDIENPYHYFRVDRGETHDRLIFGGEDHRMELRMSAEKNFQALEAHMRDKLGAVPYTVTRRWTGPILEPSDGLPLIGELKPSQLVAVAFSGSGMTYAGVAGKLLTDIVLGKEHPWRGLYDPKRIPGLKKLLYKGRDYSGELIGGAVKNALKYRKKKT